MMVVKAVDTGRVFAKGHYWHHEEEEAIPKKFTDVKLSKWGKVVKKGLFYTQAELDRMAPGDQIQVRVKQLIMVKGNKKLRVVVKSEEEDGAEYLVAYHKGKKIRKYDVETKESTLYGLSPEMGNEEIAAHNWVSQEVLNANPQFYTSKEGNSRVVRMIGEGSFLDEIKSPDLVVPYDPILH